MKLLKTLFVGTAILGATVLGGCFLNDGGSSSKEVGDGSLMIGMKVRDVNNLANSGLGKSSAIELSKLVITLTSSKAGDAVVRDTLFADSGEIDADAHTAQQVIKSYPIKALRNWTIEVKTLDVNDSVIHIASKTENNIKVGEARSVVLNLSSKFIVYLAKFALPDSLVSADTSIHQKQKLYINRLMMVVDGDTVVNNTSAPGYFQAAPTINLLEWNYASASDTHDVELYVFADSLGTWDPTRPIYGDTIQITPTDSVLTPTLPWTGPGSPNDPDYDPSNPGGAKAGLTIDINAVRQVEINPTLPGLPN
jgi:hypothetical protein